MEYQAPRILIFDSGVGALSIFREVSARLSGADIIYASDNEAFPYGTKTESFLVDRVDRVLSTLIAQYAPTVVIIACNTASTVALPHMRGKHEIPIVGVVPAIKTAALKSRSKVFGLLATPGTVSRDYTQQLIEQFAAHCKVIPLGSTELVEFIEAYLHGAPLDREQLEGILAPLFSQPHSSKMDTVVLACTHFPLIRTELEALYGGLSWIDSGEAIARRAAHFLRHFPTLPTLPTLPTAPTASEYRPYHQAVFTTAEPGIDKLSVVLHQMGIVKVDYINIAGHQ